MKVKPGALIVDFSGKAGGQVVSKNRSGHYLRNKSTPINRRSPSQIGARNRLTGFSQAWRGLTAAQILAWNSSVEDFLRTNTFGDQYKPSGFNLHLELNSNLDLVGVAVITDPPTPVAVDPVETTTLSVVNGVAAVDITFTPTPVPANHGFLVFMTPGVSAGKTFVKTEFRFLGFIDAAAVSPHDALTQYQAVFGAVPPIGMQVFVQLTPVHKVTGQRGVPLQASFVIVA